MRCTMCTCSKTCIQYPHNRTHTHDSTFFFFCSFSFYSFSFTLVGCIENDEIYKFHWTLVNENELMTGNIFECQKISILISWHCIFSGYHGKILNGIFLHENCCLFQYGFQWTLVFFVHSFLFLIWWMPCSILGSKKGMKIK